MNNGTYIDENIDLTEGQEYYIAFLSIDIAGSSKIVGKYESDLVHDVFFGFKSFVKEKVEKFNGYIWEWEGDGGTAIFTKNISSSVLCGIELVFYLTLFNNLISPLPENINIRFGLHGGNVIYYKDKEAMKLDIKILADDIQKQACPHNQFVISKEIFDKIYGKLQKNFTEFYFENLDMTLYKFKKDEALKFKI